MAGKKLSGAMLAAELSSLPDREFNPPTQGPQDGLQEVGTQEPGRVLSGREDGQPSVTRRTTVSSKSRGGRPSKAGVDGIPVNVRLSQGDHLALAKLSTKLMTPGRPLPTVQDVVRSLLRGALSEPDMAMRLCRKVGEQQ